MTVSFVIPQWNRADLLAEVLDSVCGQVLPRGVRLETIVVDNGSSDESVQVAKARGVNVIELATNEGVSRALNRGIRNATGEWVVLLNNDVELEPNWLDRLLSKAAESDAWFATGKVLDAGSRERLDGAGDAVCRGGTAWRLGNGKADGPAFAGSRSTYFPSATAALFRREFFERVGLLEESFFAYLEDVDLGMRAAIAGLNGIYVPDAVSYHAGSETAGAWSAGSVAWITRHQVLLLAKYYPIGLMLRFGVPIVVAQSLWCLMAISRGRFAAWLRGVTGALGGLRAARKAGSGLRRSSSRLARALEKAEVEIGGMQNEAGWDTYWKWYFRLAFPAVWRAA